MCVIRPSAPSTLSQPGHTGPGRTPGKHSHPSQHVHVTRVYVPSGSAAGDDDVIRASCGFQVTELRPGLLLAPDGGLLMKEVFLHVHVSAAEVGKP